MEYYTGIDAVLLVGTKQPIATHIPNSNKFLSKNDSNKETSPTVLGKLTQQIFELDLHNIPDNVRIFLSVYKQLILYALDFNNFRK